jgi:hypothetical protein
MKLNKKHFRITLFLAMIIELFVIGISCYSYYERGSHAAMTIFLFLNMPSSIVGTSVMEILRSLFDTSEVISFSVIISVTMVIQLFLISTFLYLIINIINRIKRS